MSHVRRGAGQRSCRSARIWMPEPQGWRRAHAVSIDRRQTVESPHPGDGRSVPGGMCRAAARLFRSASAAGFDVPRRRRRLKQGGHAAAHRLGRLKLPQADFRLARFARIAVTPGEVSEWSKVLDSKSSVAQATGGSNPPLSANTRPVPKAMPKQCLSVIAQTCRLQDSPESEAPAVTGAPQISGEVTEWSKVHDWKSCVSKGTEGSNPSLSAKYPRPGPSNVTRKNQRTTPSSLDAHASMEAPSLWSQMAQGL
jgi:hypothetical protein